MNRIRAYVLFAVLVLLGAVGFVQARADAGPANGETLYRAALIDGDTVVRSVPLLAQGTYTMANTTPVSGDTVCLPGDPDLFAARLTLIGTLTGSNPTLTVKLQSSDDGGKTWMDVGTSFAQINATTTPSGGVERVTFADNPTGGLNTPVAWGNCFRVLYTFGGTGTVTGNVGVSLYAE